MLPPNRRERAEAVPNAIGNDASSLESNHGFPDPHQDIDQEKANHDDLKYDVMRVRPEVVELFGDRLVGRLDQLGTVVDRVGPIVKSEPVAQKAKDPCRMPGVEVGERVGSVSNAWK